MKERKAKTLAAMRARLVGQLDTLDKMPDAPSAMQNIKERNRRMRLRGMIASIEMRLMQNDYDMLGLKKSSAKSFVSLLPTSPPPRKLVEETRTKQEESDGQA